MTTTTYPTVDLPTGEHLVMSTPPMYHLPGNAWMTKDQAEYATSLLAQMLAVGLVAAGVGTNPETGEDELVFVLVKNGVPDPTSCVMTVHQDGSALTGLPLPGQVEKFHAEHPDYAAKVENGEMTYNQALAELGEPHLPEPEPVPATMLGDYL